MLSDELLNTLGPSQQSGWIEVYDLTGPNVVLTRARRAQLVKENSSLPTANPSSTVPVIKQEPLAAGLPSMYTDACADGQSNKDDMVVPSVDADCMASQADMPTKIDGETQRKLQAKITSKNEMFSSIRKRCRKKKGACWNTKKSWTYKYSSGDRVRIFPGQCQTDSIAEVPETSPEFSPSPTQRYAGSSEPNQSVSYAKRLPTTFRRCQQDSITGTQCLSATNLDVMASVQPGLDAGIDTQIIPVAVDSTVANAGAEVPGADPTTVERTFPIVNEVPESTTAETTAAASSSPLKRALKVHMKPAGNTLELTAQLELGVKSQLLKQVMQGKVRILQWALSNHHLMGSFEYTNEPSHPIDSTKLVREILLAFMKGKGRKLPATYRLQHTTQPVNKRFSEFCDVLREYIHMLTGSAPSIEEIKGGQTAIFYESNE